MRSFSSSIWVGMMALCALGAAAQAPPQPPTGTDAIMVYAGTWKVHGERFATAYSQAGKEDKTLRNDCWKSGAYVACNQFVDGDSKALLVFTYSDKDKMYTTYQIPQGGEGAGSGKLQIVGNIWTFPWQVTQGETTMYFHVVNVFTGTDRIDYAQEFSPDNVHWNTMAKGSETKVSN
ncbi:MAG: hypothetical protein WA354_22445 [Terracidiphilus sp.]